MNGAAEDPLVDSFEQAVADLREALTPPASPTGKGGSPASPNVKVPSGGSVALVTEQALELRLAELSGQSSDKLNDQLAAMGSRLAAAFEVLGSRLEASLGLQARELVDVQREVQRLSGQLLETSRASRTLESRVDGELKELRGQLRDARQSGEQGSQRLVKELQELKGQLSAMQEQLSAWSVSAPKDLEELKGKLRMLHEVQIADQNRFLEWKDQGQRLGDEIAQLRGMVSEARMDLSGLNDKLSRDVRGLQEFPDGPAQLGRACEPQEPREDGFSLARVLSKMDQKLDLSIKHIARSNEDNFSQLSADMRQDLEQRLRSAEGRIQDIASSMTNEVAVLKSALRNV